MTDDLERRLREASLFPRIVTHDEARQSAKNFIDAHFNNRDGKGVLTGIPARAEHDDLVLSDYIRQRRVADEAQTDEIARLRAENEALREALVPFAEAAEDLEESTHDSCSMWEHHVSINVEAGDFRRAAAAIRSGDEG